MIKILGLMMIALFLYHNINNEGSYSEYVIMTDMYKWTNKEIHKIIRKESRDKDVDYRLVYAIIQAESGDYCGNNLQCMKTAVSPSGAIGMMQVMEFHYIGNIVDLLEPEINISVGTMVLAMCIRCSGSLRDTLKCYERGPYGVGYNEPYIKKVLKNYHMSVMLTDGI